MALAFVTLMLRNIADAVELGVREEILPKLKKKEEERLLITADYKCKQTLSRKVSARMATVRDLGGNK